MKAHSTLLREKVANFVTGNNGGSTSMCMVERVSFRDLKDENGVIIGSTCICRDIEMSERKYNRTSPTGH